MPTASLGGIPIAISAATATTLNGTVPAGIPAGIYDLTVQNPDLQSDTLFSAYTALVPVTPPPTVLSITPNEGCNSGDVLVVIRGSDFFGMPTAEIMTSPPTPIAITAATTDTLTGTVPAGIPFGVYGLTVRNPDGQTYNLSPAYIVHCPVTTLETGELMTFGTAASSPANGDNDQVQVIFFEVPDTVTGPLYVHIFDPDLGTDNTFDEYTGSGWDTSTAFSLYGGLGAFTDSNARRAVFATTSDPGISSGTLITSQTFAVNATLDGDWHLFATINDPLAQGEPVGNRRIFKLSVIGANNGDDGNRYIVAMSTLSTTHDAAPAGSRIFAYSWTIPLTSTRRLYPYVPAGTLAFEQHNWDLDNDVTMEWTTPTTGPFGEGSISGNNAEASSSYSVDALQDEATWTAEMTYTGAGWNDLAFWVLGDSVPLAIFTIPTISPPP
jgi:hypothetical protein